MPEQLRIATCQFPVSGNLKRNLWYILDLIYKSGQQNAHVAHFSECVLTGYGGIDYEEFPNDPSELREAIERIKKAARKASIWVILGSPHYEKETQLPYNSLYLINKIGILLDRYDKRLLAGPPKELDNKYYSPGSTPITFEVGHVKCGLLICHEWRYPELYREYARKGVKLIFHSWYDGNLSQPDYQAEGKNLGQLVPGTVRGNAANNHIWISASNTSKKESSFASFVARPDGTVAGKLHRNKTGILITDIDPDKKFSDPSYYNRKKYNL